MRNIVALVALTLFMTNTGCKKESVCLIKVNGEISTLPNYESTIEANAAGGLQDTLIVQGSITSYNELRPNSVVVFIQFIETTSVLVDTTTFLGGDYYIKFPISEIPGGIDYRDYSAYGNVTVIGDDGCEHTLDIVE